MISTLKNNRQSYFETIASSLEEYSYRNKRYHVDFAIALGLCKENVNFGEFIKSQRKTDELILLEDNLCCAIFDSAPTKSAIKATSNMLTKFKNKNSDKQLYTGVVSSKDYESDKTMLNSLFDILEYSINNNMPDVIMDKQHIEISAI